MRYLYKNFNQNRVMDTKGTKELIIALNPNYELRASIQKEKEFIETSRLVQDEQKKKAFKTGINYLKNKSKKIVNRFRGKKSTRKIRKGSVLNSLSK